MGHVNFPRSSIRRGLGEKVLLLHHLFSFSLMLLVPPDNYVIGGLLVLIYDKKVKDLFNVVKSDVEDDFPSNTLYHLLLGYVALGQGHN